MGLSHGQSKTGNLISSFFAPWLNPFLDPMACLPQAPEKTALPTEPDALLSQLELLLRRRLAEMTPGDRSSLLRGQGLDFAELREYHPGDDIRKMDWSVLARTLTPHVREYHADQQQTWWLVVDCTQSMFFGSVRRKIDLALELAALLGLVAEGNNHLLGGVILGAHPSRSSLEIIHPRSGRASLQRLLLRMMKLTETLGCPSPSTALPAIDPLSQSCQQLGSLVSKTSTVFLISDFLAWPLSKNQSQEAMAGAPKVRPAVDPARNTKESDIPLWQLSLGQLSQKAKLVSLPVSDPVELALPENLGFLNVQDLETGDLLSLDTADSGFLHAYKETVHQSQERLHAWLAKIGQVVPITTSQPALDNLLPRPKHALLSSGMGQSVWKGRP